VEITVNQNNVEDISHKNTNDLFKEFNSLPIIDEQLKRINKSFVVEEGFKKILEDLENEKINQPTSNSDSEQIKNISGDEKIILNIKKIDAEIENSFENNKKKYIDEEENEIFRYFHPDLKHFNEKYKSETQKLNKVFNLDGYSSSRCLIKNSRRRAFYIPLYDKISNLKEENLDEIINNFYNLNNYEKWKMNQLVNESISKNSLYKLDNLNKNNNENILQNIMISKNSNIIENKNIFNNSTKMGSSMERNIKKSDLNSYKIEEINTNVSKENSYIDFILKYKKDNEFNSKSYLNNEILFQFIHDFETNKNMILNNNIPQYFFDKKKNFENSDLIINLIKDNYTNEKISSFLNDYNRNCYQDNEEISNENIDNQYHKDKNYLITFASKLIINNKRNNIENKLIDVKKKYSIIDSGLKEKSQNGQISFSSRKNKENEVNDNYLIRESNTPSKSICSLNNDLKNEYVENNEREFILADKKVEILENLVDSKSVKLSANFANLRRRKFSTYIFLTTKINFSTDELIYHLLIYSLEKLEEFTDSLVNEADSLKGIYLELSEKERKDFFRRIHSLEVSMHIIFKETIIKK